MAGSQQASHGVSNLSTDTHKALLCTLDARKQLIGVSRLQLQDKSLAEALLSGSGRELRLRLPWGPSVEDALLGPAGPSSGPEEEKPDQQELSSKVMHPFCIQLHALNIMTWPGSPNAASEGTCECSAGR